MSTDTLFRPIPTTSINDVQSNNNATISTTAVVSTPASFNSHIVTAPNVLTPSAEINNSNPFTSTLPTKKDVSNIPPAFFVGPSQKEEPVIIEPQHSDDSKAKVIQRDRRLSGILAEAIDKHEEEKKEESLVSVKRVALGTADANRGIFGDKRFRVNNNTNDETIDTNSTLEISTQISTLQPSKTIRVFGYPSNLVHNVIQHFMNYGKIEKYQESPGNWMTITYENSSMALAALKSNGMAISKSYLIGVSLEKEETEKAVTQKVIPMDVSNGVFKNLSVNSNDNKKNGLGSGKVGVSADNKNNASTGGIISRLKDTFFGW